MATVGVEPIEASSVGPGVGEYDGSVVGSGVGHTHSHVGLFEGRGCHGDGNGVHSSEDVGESVGDGPSPLGDVGSSVGSVFDMSLPSIEGTEVGREDTDDGADEGI